MNIESDVLPNQIAIDRAMRDVAFNKYDYIPRILTKDVDFKWSIAPLNGGKGYTGVIELKKGQLVSVKIQSGSLGDNTVVRVYNNDGSVQEYSKMGSNVDFGTFLSIKDYQEIK